jgi:hypothetical protein
MAKQLSTHSSKEGAVKKATLSRTSTTGRFVIGSDAPTLSVEAKSQVARTRPSKKAAKLAASVAKSKVRQAVV